jgi:3-oxoacyl-[acyl-carrier protein] reductase
MDEIKGKIALVTGASRGIGRSVALELARIGVNVAVNYKSHGKEAEEVRRELESLGRRAFLVQADVARSDEVTRMASAVEKELGPIEILVNNAGVARTQAIEETTEKDWDEILEINLKSVFLVTQAVLPGMRRRRWGRIVNISSGAAATGGIVGVHYSASKAGIEGLTKAYASRLVKEGITVNAVAPALIQTDMTGTNAADVERRRKLIPMGRLGRPEETAAAVVFLAANAYMTGQTVHVNGGFYFR